MRLILAPMEGVLDSLVRELLTSINQYDLCITEFIRITDSLLSAKAFYRVCPELRNGSKTQSGTPVRIQLLGQSPEYLALNAARAVELGSFGVDFNCGCPSKMVNGHGGGALLLQTPEKIYQALHAMRQAVPADLPLTAKIRLGWDSPNHALEIAYAVQQAGANEIAVHGRTKMDGYQADKINWQAIADIRKHLTIPVIANGEIVSYQSAQDCSSVTGCRDLMIGRAALSIPNISLVIKQNAENLPWEKVIHLLNRYRLLEKQGDIGLYHLNRIKQWLNYLRQTYLEAESLFMNIRPLKRYEQIAHYFD